MNIGKIIEYGQIPADSSARKIILESATVTEGRMIREYFLSHSTEGYEPAGSMARWTNEYWSVTFDIQGATNGRRFSTLQDAERVFHDWTHPAKDETDDMLVDSAERKIEFPKR